MNSIKICTNLPKEKINNIIHSYPFAYEFSIESDSFENRETYSFNLSKNSGEDIKLYSNLADLTQEIITRLYMHELIDEKLSIMMKELYDQDMDEIKVLFYDLYYDDNCFVKEKVNINKELRDYLTENDTLIIDGYLMFRRNSYEKLIDEIIQKINFDITMENEYEDFIYTLQYYLDSQVPKIDILNIIIKDNEFSLVDSSNESIENPTIDSIIEEFGIEDISQADILVTSLIILAPEKVIVHIGNDKEKELMRILKKIFNRRLSFCYGCDLCHKHSNKSNGKKS